MSPRASIVCAAVGVLFAAGATCELVRIEHQVRALSDQIHIAASASSVVAAQVSTPRASHAPSKAADERAASVTAAFQTDTNDSSWNKEQTTAKLTRVLPAGVTLDAVECRSTLCRVDTRAPDFDRFNTFARAAFAQPGTRIFTGDTMNVPLPGAPSDKAIATATYISRQGRFPDFK